MLSADTNGTPGPARPANFPDPSPELVLIMALLHAMREADTPAGRRRRASVLTAVEQQVEALNALPFVLSRETVPIRRAAAGAQAVMAQLAAAGEAVVRRPVPPSGAN